MVIREMCIRDRFPVYNVQILLCRPVIPCQGPHKLPGIKSFHTVQILDFFHCVIHGDGSVSYTHLDVYKRQA